MVAYGCVWSHYSYLLVILLLFMLHILDKITNSISKLTHREKISSDLSETYIYCRFCGRKNPENRTSCKARKMRIDVAPSEVLNVCKKCDSAVNYDDVYCSIVVKQFSSSCICQGFLKLI